MFTRRRSAMLLAALLLLAAALLPSLHRLQHVDVDVAATSHCAHDHSGGSTALEPVAAADDDCGLCLLLRAGRDWHGTGAPERQQGTALPVAVVRIATTATTRLVTAATVHARAPPRLLGC